MKTNPMMTLQIIAAKKELLEEIADLLLGDQLIANAMISEKILYKETKHGKIQTTEQFLLKCISKSLLFHTINKKLRKRYGEKTPLIYSEPIILIDPSQTDALVAKLVKV
jgi:hypothetical protein